jgi:hypothetical protein
VTFLSHVKSSAYHHNVKHCPHEREDQRGGRVVSVPLYQAKAEFFRTLGHPARIRVLELLS